MTAHEAAMRAALERSPTWTALCQLLDEMLPFIEADFAPGKQERLDERRRWFARAETIAHAALAAAPAAPALDVERLARGWQNHQRIENKAFEARTGERHVSHQCGWASPECVAAIAAEYARLAGAAESRDPERALED